MAYVRREAPVVVHEDEHTYGATIARRVILYLLDVLEVLLAFRFFLRLLGANAASPFVAFIYAVTEPFVYPFRGIFPEIAAEGNVLEWAVVLAMVVYAVIAWGIVRLIWILSAHREPVETDVVEDRTVVHEEPTVVRREEHHHDDDSLV